MATPDTVEEAAIRARIDELAGAIRARDLEALKSIYATDIVSFDVGPDLQTVGADAKWGNWEAAFTMLHPPLGYDIRDLTITVSGDMALAHGFNRLSGTARDGRRFGPWVRATICLRKIDGRWVVVHDHVSVPLDMATGKGIVDLEPPGR